MHREARIQNVRSTIDKLILSKNHFLSKLLAIIASNEDAYLINEVILLLLLVAESSGEVRNIITYERFIETVMRIIQDEHAYLFRPTSDLYFLYQDGNVVVPKRKTKISPLPAASGGNEKREEMNHRKIGKTESSATEITTIERSAFQMIAPHGEKPQSEQEQMEIYLDNISINIDLKSSLLLLKCLIISSEFGLKYIYELNIFEQFIKLVLNMYNVIIYICKNDMRKYFSNSIFVLNVFLDVLASSCKVDGVNSYTGLSSKKFLLILQKERFFESSFFFFFKFMCIYMEKYANGGRQTDQLGYHRNENCSNYDAGSEAPMAVEFSRLGKGPLPGGSNNVSLSGTVSANVSASASSVFPSSDSGGGQMGSNPVAASIGSNFAGSSQTGSGQGGRVQAGCLHGGGLHTGSSVHTETEQIMRTFKNTHFVGILNMCCKFLLQDESLCVRVLFIPFALSGGGEESSQSVDKEHDVNSFVEALLKQKNYFHLEQVLTYYMKHLKQIKCADMLLIMFLYDRKKLFCNSIYEFFLFLGGKHAQVGKYLVESLFSRRAVFNYCVMHTARKVSKLLLKLKKAFQRRNKSESKLGGKNSDELGISGVNGIPQKETFFLKYMNLSELLLRICNLTSSNNPHEMLHPNERLSSDERPHPAEEFLKSAEITFEQLMYYNELFARDYNGMWKHHVQKANERFSESVLTFRINSILYRRNVKGQIDSLKFLLPMLSNNWGSKKNSCLICVYIAIYLFKSNEEKEKKKIVQIIMRNDLFNIMYNSLNRFCRFTFDEKYFFFVSFEKSKDAHENIRGISDLRRKKYFFNYSKEMSIFCIHFVYSNFIHHSMLTYFFEQSKSYAYRKDHPGRNRNGYYSPKRSHSGADRHKDGGDAECILSESEDGESSPAEMHGEGSQSDDWRQEDRHVDAPNRKRCDDYSLDDYHQSSASSGVETATRHARRKKKGHLFYSKGGAEKERNYLKNKPMKTKGKGITRGRKDNTDLMSHISEEVSQLRDKLNQQEVTHLEEKIYLNKIIEKKNDIINNMLYSYSMMKAKCEQVESELIKVRIDLGLKEKEYQLVADNDMDHLKAEHIRVLRDYERVSSEKRELETQFEKLTDLLIFLYENVAPCRHYMQNVEDVKVFKNPTMGANRGGDPSQPNCDMWEVERHEHMNAGVKADYHMNAQVVADDHMNAEMKGSVDPLTQPNDQLNRGGYQPANDQVCGLHNGGAYANLYNPVQQNFPPQGYQNSPYEGNAYGNAQQQILQGSTYSYSNQQMDKGCANSHPPQQMHQGSTYGYPPEPMQQVHMYGDPNPGEVGTSNQGVCNEMHPPVTQPPPDREYEQQYGQLYEHAPPQMWNQLYFQSNPHVYPHMYVESTGQNASGSNAELNVSAGDQGDNSEGPQGQPNEKNCPAEFTGQ
ncbi:hypothetical protein C922_02992 [Plasmodium inui San Antonio 1]|uniref:Uncharacterized protein n=1 Tax=Plasmodium inui San Antonio 1 TaxID=1237626 RepID=W7AMZ4_9APIC|nr:hypothetical protein C922_02992 [Plasmodium inui San Antonio 1]EUD66671.1 hypothetical protein C922_02992 [Plasmodium inui San Antonio 1]